MHIEWTWVDTAQKMEYAVADINGSSRIGMDTEYDSFRYFRDKLCLIQIRTATMTYLFDPLNGLDLCGLKTSFISPAIIKILHAGDNDIRLLKRDYGFHFTNVFDTHKAASILGGHYLSLTHLVAQYLGIDFVKKKKIQRSRWDIRPLTEEQLTYAAWDTAYLSPLYDALAAEIRRNGFEAAAAKSFADIADLTWQEKKLYPFSYKRIKGYATLREEEKKRLKRLYQWRFQAAKALNRAVFMVLQDQTLLDLSKMENPSVEELTGTNTLSKEQAHLFGKDIIACLTVKEPLSTLDMTA